MADAAAAERPALLDTYLAEIAETQRDLLMTLDRKYVGNPGSVLVVFTRPDGVRVSVKASVEVTVLPPEGG